MRRRLMQDPCFKVSTLRQLLNPLNPFLDLAEHLVARDAFREPKIYRHSRRRRHCIGGRPALYSSNIHGPTVKRAVITRTQVDALKLSNQLSQRDYRVAAQLWRRPVCLYTAAFNFDPQDTLLAIDGKVHSPPVRDYRHVELDPDLIHKIDDAKLRADFFVGGCDQ